MKSWYFNQVTLIIDDLKQAQAAIMELALSQEERLGKYPENLQGSANYEKGEERLETFEEIQSQIEDIIEVLEDL